MQSTRHARMRLLLAGCAFAALAWTQWSIQSPVAGWGGRCVDGIITGVWRLFAVEPCSPCESTTRVVGGVTIAYPAVLEKPEKVWKVGEWSQFAVMDRWERYGLVFSVSTLPAGKEERVRELWIKQIHVAERRRVNGWDVLVERPRHGPGTSVHALGAHHVVSVDEVLDGRLAGTALARWLDASFWKVVEKICNGNPADLAATGSSKAPPNHGGAPATAAPGRSSRDAERRAARRTR